MTIQEGLQEIEQKVKTLEDEKDIEKAVKLYKEITQKYKEVTQELESLDEEVETVYKEANKDTSL